MEIALYPGSFDPITKGHLDIIKRASKKFDKMYVGVINNINKEGFLSLDERVELAKGAVAELANVEVISFTGLTITCAQKHGAQSIVRGLRAISDFEYELQLASTNHNIDPNIETLFLMASTKYSYLSSSLVRELAVYGADISLYVPECVEQALVRKQKEKSEQNEKTIK